ncbi:MAG: glycosyltransferase family 2 protein, partial [Candidatus Woesearchaeota archaeon]
MKPKISAIICTYNRDKYLPKAIQSLVDQTLDASQYEIVVVDNRSTDQTK